MISPHSCKRDEKVGVERKPTDPKLKNKKAILIGYDVRALNTSAKTSGLITLAIDCFADMDLRRLADQFIHVNLDRFKDSEGKLKNPSVHYLYEELNKYKEEFERADYLLLGSGFENYPEYIRKIEEFKNYYGSSADSIEKVRKYNKFYPFLKDLNIKFPKSVLFEFKDENKIDYLNYFNSSEISFASAEKTSEHQINSLEEFYTKNIEKSLRFPLVLKSEKTGGGFGIYKLKNEKDFYDKVTYLNELKPSKLILQEFIEGTPMSCSFISNGEKAKCVLITKQIIGEKRFGCLNDFAYCGNITNKKIMETKINGKSLISVMDEIIQKIVKFSNLKGSNGIDFIIYENDIYFIELNARFQGTIDVFEAFTGYNIVELHIKSIENDYIPDKIDFPDNLTIMKSIFYSPLEFHILADLEGLNFRDTPLIGNFFQEGEPLCSSIIEAKSEEEAFLKALDDRDLITRVLGIKSRISKNSKFLKN